MFSVGYSQRVKEVLTLVIAAVAEYAAMTNPVCSGVIEQ